MYSIAGRRLPGLLPYNEFENEGKPTVDDGRRIDKMFMRINFMLQKN